MKNLYLFILAAFVALCANAQSEQFSYPDAFYFVKEIKTAGLAERPFHIEITVKENPADSLSKPRIYAVQVRKGKEDIIGRSMQYATATGGEWKTYSIDGITEKEATRIWFYAAVNGNGSFYFDKLQFSIADGTGTLQEQDVSNQSFEDRKILNGYFINAQPSKDLQVVLSPVAVDGKQSVQVISAHQKPAGARGVVKN
ncbi:MAG TPA: hypothetical protein VL307_13720 [Chitinophagaceae bacterium]|nr:hypothetical protein [Chitinophagaceae bacterium]